MGGAGPLGVVAVSLSQHRVLWQRPIPGALEGVDDTVIAVSATRLITAALAGPPGITATSKQHEAKIFALNPETGAVIWSQTVARGAAPSFKATGTPVVVGQRVYAGNAINGRVVALSLATGKMLWAVPVGSPVTRPPAVLDHRIYVFTKSGELVAISSRGKIVAEEAVADLVNTYGPMIYNDTLLISGNTAYSGYVGAFPLFGRPT
jgi:outer membrane protein assembly factor BamB